jgi:phosphoribosylformylglycinamidine (FGAM) synthase-like enzyme
VRACHDLSEGGLAVAAAEMAFAGNLGARLLLAEVPREIDPDENAAAVLLFSESNTRFLCEVRPAAAAGFEAAMAGVPCRVVGEVDDGGRLQVVGLRRAIPDAASGGPGEMVAPLVVDADLSTLKEAWQEPLDW